MKPDFRPWLDLARSLGPDHGRGAADFPEASLQATAGFLASKDWPASIVLHPWGLDLESGGLWEPWARAREAVELLPEGPQERGARADYLAFDRVGGSVTLGWVGSWRPACPRFTARACPRMASMGHESPRAECNYWAWSGMARVAPGIELYPEWQRFDCHRNYPLFQMHLCGEALAGLLDAVPRWVFHAPAEAAPVLRAYAALTNRPEAFILEPWPEASQPGPVRAS